MLPRFVFDIQKVNIGEQLGQGGSGSVYKAVLLDTNETVAVKHVFTDDDKKIVASCRSLCKKLITLQSDYIVRFIGMSESPKHFYFITELATGGSLMQALQSHPMRDDLATLLRWALDIVSGLKYLHSQQPCVLHLDIKPQNVLLFGCGVAKLCDFDISQVTEHTQTAPREGATYRYAAPEQLLDGGMVSAATDIYGLGGVFYVMVLKKEPWNDIREPQKILSKHIGGEAVPILSLPPGCHACIMDIAAECLQRNKERRPTLEQVQQKLRSLLCDAEGARKNTMQNAPPSADAAKVAKLEQQLSKTIAERDIARQEASSAPQPLRNALLMRCAPVTWPSGMSDDSAVTIARSLFDVGGSFHKPMRRICGFNVCFVDIVRNDGLNGAFSNYFTRLKMLRNGNEALFHQACKSDEQREVLHTLKTLFHPVLPGAWRDPRTLTVYHGCCASTARKIANDGFGGFAQDRGNLGPGVYVTANAEYACQHGVHDSSTEPHSPEHPDWFPVLLCTAVVGLVYPVTRQVDLPLNTPNYDAHFTVVNPAASDSQYGELCVLHSDALLPLAILWVSKSAE